MQEKVKSLEGYGLHSLDGEIGKVKEFYFDDKYWTIRYLVADTGNWLPGRQVLISPHALSYVNKKEKTISVDLTKKQIEESPSLDSERPVSRQFEESYYGYYQFPAYWTGSYMWGAYPFFVRDAKSTSQPIRSDKVEDYHLRSTNAVTGHHIQATNGEIGHIVDFIIDDHNWAIRYLVVDTNNWLPGKKVLISPPWIESVNWGQSKVFVRLSREAIKNSPEFKEASRLTREYETQLHGHYSLQGYWVEELAAQRDSLAAPHQNRDSPFVREIKN